jgi:hypothetical protein
MTIQAAQSAGAEDATLEVEDIPAIAFAGRVLAAFVALVVLAVFVLAMVALAYWSKNALPVLHSPPGGQKPAAAPMF